MPLTVAEAQRAILEVVKRAPAETCAVDRAVGRVLASSPRAPGNLPAHALSVMDGYAVRAADTGRGRTLTIAGESAAGHPADHRLRAGECIRISTGAVVPTGADAVVAQEDTTHDGDTITLATDAIAPGTFVRAVGSEVREGDLLVPAGATLGPGDASLIASAGHGTVQVGRRPRVAILPNGDELVAPGQAPGPGQVVGTNDFMLAAQVREAGGEPVILPPVGDAPEDVRTALGAALEHDVVVSTGGISVGPHDQVLETLAALGAELVFRKVAVRPGKPTTVARRGSSLVFALPGNPASTFVTFELFVRPALRAMLGAPPMRQTRVVQLGAPAPGMKTREHYVRARIEGDVAVPHTAQASGNLRSISGVQALIPVPAGVDALPAGSSVRALLLPDPWPA